MFGTTAVLDGVIVCLSGLKAVTNGGAQMVTKPVANDSERPTHCSFAPQALLMAPDDRVLTRQSPLTQQPKGYTNGLESVSESTGQSAYFPSPTNSIAPQPPDEVIEALIGAIERELCLAPGILQSRARDQHVGFVRHVAFYLCRKINRASFPVIGKHFGRDHTTVIHGYRLITHRMERETGFRRFVEKLEGQITGTVSTTARAAT